MDTQARKSPVWNLLLLVASIGLGLLVLEGAARYLKIAPAVLRLNPGTEDSAFRFSDNPVLGYEFKPGYRDDDADLHQSFPAVNSDGFRDVERSRDKPAGVRRILVLGDSVTAGVGIRNLADLIPQQLEQRLAGRGYEVLNLGVPGYCTYGEVELLATRGLAYQPDHVIVVFVENDYVPGNFLFAEYSFDRPPGAEWLFLHSDLFRWASLRWNWFQFAAIDPVQEQRDGRDLALTRYAYNRFHQAVGSDANTVNKALTRLRALADEHGFGVTVAIWPRFSPSLILEGDHELVDNEILAVKVARDLGFSVVRLTDDFRADYNREFNRRGTDVNALDLYTIGRDDPMHPNAHGAAVAADALAAAVVKEGR